MLGRLGLKSKLKDALGEPRTITDPQEIKDLLERLNEATGKDQLEDAPIGIDDIDAIEVTDNGIKIISVSAEIVGGGGTDIADILSMLGAGPNKGGKPDLDGLMGAMRFSDRHGGKSSIGDAKNLEGLLRSILGGKGSKASGDEVAKDFFAKLNERDEKPKAKLPKGPLLSILIGSGAVLSASEMLAFCRDNGEGDLRGTEAFLQMIEEVREDDPERFDRLDNRVVSSFGVSLSIAIESTRRAVESKEVAEVRKAAESLSILVPAFLVAFSDASKEAKQQAEELLSL